MMGEDFLCSYQPQGGAVICALNPEPDIVNWSDGAEAHISRVPGFVRRMVRRRAEEYVRGEGRFEVTSDDLTLLARRRFGDKGPPSYVRKLRPSALTGGDNG